jgi:hypothetical protein
MRGIVRHPAAQANQAVGGVGARVVTRTPFAGLCGNFCLWITLKKWVAPVDCPGRAQQIGA